MDLVKKPLLLVTAAADAVSVDSPTGATRLETLLAELREEASELRRADADDLTSPLDSRHAEPPRDLSVPAMLGALALTKKEFWQPWIQPEFYDDPGYDPGRCRGTPRVPC
jgi:hypothetical protein